MSENLLKVLNYSLLKLENNVTFSFKRQGSYLNFTKQFYIDISDNIAYAFLKIGVEKNDNILIISENRPEWNFVDLAVLKVGAVSVPLYATVSDNQIFIVLKETTPKIVFVSSKYLSRRVKAIIEMLGFDIKIYTFDKIEDEEDIIELSKKGENYKNPIKLNEIESSINENDVYSILYSSGTERKPKGVLLKHKGQLDVINSIIKSINVKDGYKTVHYLPLSNAFGRFVNYVCQISGITIFYVNGITHLQKYLKQIEPEFLATTPLFLENVMELAINENNLAKSENTIKNKIFVDFIQKRGFNNKYTIDNFKYTDFFYEKNKNLMGGNMEIILTGGALIPPKVQIFFSFFNFILLSGYGLTETSGVISVDSYNKKRKIGKCGQVIDKTQIMLSENGEILVKGNNVMQGYYKDKELTKKIIDDDGWLHTGDIGFIDEDGFIEITDRLKSTFKLKSGDFVYPEPIEENLRKSPQIEDVIVGGLGGEFIVAIIIPNEKFIEKIISEKNIIIKLSRNIIINKEIISIFDLIINKYNSIIYGKSKRIEKFIIVSDNWGGSFLKTEIERNTILLKYKTQINKINKI